MFQSTLNDRLAKLEEFLNRPAAARGSSSSSTDLEGASTPKLGSPQPIDEARTPQPNTTPKPPPRQLQGLEVASTSEHTAARDSNVPFLLPAFSPRPPPESATGPVENPPTRPSSETPSGSNKRKLEEQDGHASVPSPKRMKPDINPEELEGTGLAVQAVQDGFTTPPNPQPASPLAPALRPHSNYPFSGGSPSPQSRQPGTPAPGGSRHRVPNPARRPEATSSTTQPMAPFVGEVIPGAPVQMVAAGVRGDDARRTPEPTSSRAAPNHIVASGTLASAVGGGFNPPSSSTPARPGPSSHVMWTSAATSRPMRALPYMRPPLINATAPSLPPAAIPAVGPAIEGRDGSGSQDSDSTNSGGAVDANQVPALEPVETGVESPTPNRAILRQGRGISTPGVPPGGLDPFRFTGAFKRRSGRANPEIPTTPELSARQVAPETPMASPTRYGTEINPSMRHLY